jgi:hypothetical protein
MSALAAKCQVVEDRATPASERAGRLEEARASRDEGLHAARGLQVRVLIALIAGAALLSAAPAHGAAKKTVNLGETTTRRRP